MNMGPANIERACKPANNLKVQIKPTMVYLSNQNDENKTKISTIGDGVEKWVL